MYECLVVLACESLHVRTVCMWRCKHARFRVDVFMRHTYIFIQSYRLNTRSVLGMPSTFIHLGFFIFVLLSTASSSSTSITTDFLTQSEDQCHFYVGACTEVGNGA